MHKVGRSINWVDNPQELVLVAVELGVEGRRTRFLAGCDVLFSQKVVVGEGGEDRFANGLSWSSDASERQQKVRPIHILSSYLLTQGINQSQQISTVGLTLGDFGATRVPQNDVSRLARGVNGDFQELVEDGVIELGVHG